MSFVHLIVAKELKINFMGLFPARSAKNDLSLFNDFFSLRRKLKIKKTYFFI
jgi:hypothetical protein